MTNSTQMVNFDRQKLEELKKEYSKARAAGASTFVYGGHDYLVDYAKYLIEYLEGKLL